MRKSQRACSSEQNKHRHAKLKWRVSKGCRETGVSHNVLDCISQLADVTAVEAGDRNTTITREEHLRRILRLDFGSRVVRWVQSNRGQKRTWWREVRAST